MSGLQERLEALVDDTRDLKLGDPGNLSAYYATLGLDLEEFVEVVRDYVGGIGAKRGSAPPPLTLVVSIAARMYELGYRAGKEAGDG